MHLDDFCVNFQASRRKQRGRYQMYRSHVGWDWLQRRVRTPGRRTRPCELGLIGRCRCMKPQRSPHPQQLSNPMASAAGREQVQEMARCMGEGWVPILPRGPRGQHIQLLLGFVKTRDANFTPYFLYSTKSSKFGIKLKRNWALWTFLTALLTYNLYTVKLIH